MGYLDLITPAAGHREGDAAPISDAAPPKSDDKASADEPIGSSADAVSSVVPDTKDITGADQPADTTRSGHRRFTLVFGVLLIVALMGLGGWFGYRTYQAVQVEHQRSQFLEAGRRGAVELTTINYNQIDADVARILNSATDPFYQDFQQRSQPFVDMVRKTQSKTEGTVAEAGLESVQGNQADVLVVVSVKTSLAGTETQPRLWRMRITVQKVGDETKVSNVAFVP